MTEQSVQRKELALRWVIVAAAAVVVLILAGLVYNGITNRAVLNEVRSCTKPGGECYKRGQENTGTAVESINKVVLYAATCADKRGVNTQSEIEACVLDLLKGSK
jgi:glutaminase